MGTLKDEMKEDRLLGEKAEDGEDPGSSDGTAVTDATLNNTVESTRQDNEPQMDYNEDSVCVKADATVNMERQSISVAVPSTPDPLDPRSPAPVGQHHMRTQVSLEVVQCHSAATSPMTPPEGGHDHSFFFPCSFGKAESAGTDTKDVELQVGQQVEYSSVATSPMTPKTPFFSTFSLVQSQKKTEDGTKNPPASEASKCPAGSSERKPQRMGSMDQDITILVTQHGNTEEEEDKDSTQSNVQCAAETETVKEEGVQSQEGKGSMSDHENSNSAIKNEETPVKSEVKSATSLEAQDNKDIVPESPAPFGCHNMRTQVSLEVVQCHSAATSPMTPPEGDQAFCFPTVVGTETKDAELQVGQQVEYRSVATAPMTPRTPTAITFPEILKCPSIEEKIVEEEEESETPKEKCGEDQKGDERDKKDDGDDGGEGGREGCKEGGAGEGAGDEERGDGGKDGEGGDGDGGGGGGGGREGEEQTEEEHEEEEDCKEDKSEEPVQEVSWDEKGMTWEVYGAVVEVSVLGSAIQKHLEKQVKKQKKPTLPPPPPLNPSATPLCPSEATPRSTGSGKGRGSKRAEKPRRNRRNPFRLMMENMQQPHCCSRAHTTE